MPLKRKEWPGFTVNPDEYYEIFMPLSAEDADSLLMALLYFCKTGDDPVEFHNPSLQHNYQRLKEEILHEKQEYALVCYRRSHAGKRKWKDRKDAANPEQASDFDFSDIDLNANAKNCYGFHCNVFLTPRELAELKRSYPFRWERLIKDYDNWAHSTGDASLQGDLTDLYIFADQLKGRYE